MKKDKSQITPPKLAIRLLHWFLKDELAEEVTGDLEEKFFSTLEKSSQTRAKRNYWFQVIKYMRPFAFKKQWSTHSNNTAMFRHTLLISFRSFRRYKSTFFINLLGLASGLACTLLIYLWVTDELSTDRFHQNKEQLYQVLQNARTGRGIVTMEHTPSLLGKELMEQLPEVDKATTLLPHTYFDGFSYLIQGENYLKVKEQYIDAQFFDVFTFPMVAGDHESMFRQPNQTLISRDLAERTFGSVYDAMGKTIGFQNDSFEEDYIIGGVFENVPGNSSLYFEILFNFDTYRESIGARFDSWN